MLKRFSWILASLALYYAGLAFYMLQDNFTEFWVSYFYCLNAYLILIGLAFNFKHRKTHRELQAIFFTAGFRALLIIYYIVALFVVDDKEVMNKQIVFWCILGIGGFIGLICGNYNNYGKQ